MNISCKRIALHAGLSLALLLSSGVSYANEAADAPVPVVSQSINTPINDHISVQVRGVYNEKISDGVHLGAVIKMNNTSEETLRVPDHELRMTAANGVTYTLKPSMSNPGSIEPQSNEDLVYYKVVNKESDISLNELSLVDVNYDVYPKLETNLATVPIQSVTWNGRSTSESSQGEAKQWGEVFTIPNLDSSLIYTPTQFTSNHTSDGMTYIVKLLVENPTNHKENIPNFGVDGKNEERIYKGKRLEAKFSSLEPGEKKYIYYSISTDMDVTLDSLNVLTTEAFTAANQETTFDIGKVHIALPSADIIQAAKQYTFGDTILVDQLSNFIPSELNISLMELHKSANEEDGNQTVLAKFRLTNTASRFLPVPEFQTELWTADGHSYSGDRQKAAITQIESGTSATVSYSFTLPDSQAAQNFQLKLLDHVSAKPYNTEIAASDVTLQTPEEDLSHIELYPYTLDFKYFRAVSIIKGTPANSMNYTYNLHLDINVQRDNRVNIDNNFSKLKIELYDAYGKSLGTRYIPFTGVDRLTSGTGQEIIFDGLTMDQATDRVTIKFYESITTNKGESNRLLFTRVQN